MENRIYKWVAVCGTNVYREENNHFNQIDKDNLEYFILEGQGTMFKHNVRTGQIFINDNALSMLINDRLIGKSTDIINYKDVFATVSVEGTSTSIVGYLTGWKQGDIEGFKNIESVFWIDMVEQALKIRIRVTPEDERVLKNSTITINTNGMMQSYELGSLELDKVNEIVYLIPLG